MIKRKTLKQQRIDAELEAIIEAFGRAMRHAHRPFIAGQWIGGVGCPFFTPNMERAWNDYAAFCERHPE